MYKRQIVEPENPGREPPPPDLRLETEKEGTGAAADALPAKSLNTIVQLLYVSLRFKEYVTVFTPGPRSVLVPRAEQEPESTTVKGSFDCMAPAVKVIVADPVPPLDVTLETVGISLSSIVVVFDVATLYPNTPNTCLLYTSPSPRD